MDQSKNWQPKLVGFYIRHIVQKNQSSILIDHRISYRLITSHTCTCRKNNIYDV